MESGNIELAQHIPEEKDATKKKVSIFYVLCVSKFLPVKVQFLFPLFHYVRRTTMEL